MGVAPMGTRGMGVRRCRERGPTGRKQHEAESRGQEEMPGRERGGQTREQGWVTPREGRTAGKTKGGREDGRKQTRITTFPTSVLAEAPSSVHRTEEWPTPWNYGWMILNSLNYSECAFSMELEY